MLLALKRVPGETESSLAAAGTAGATRGPLGATRLDSALQRRDVGAVRC